MERKPKVILGTWSWGCGAVGGDQVFGNHLDADKLKGVFNTAMEAGLNCWDTAVVYGMGASEEILSSFTKPLPRESYTLSTKFTPQIANETADNPVASMLESSLDRFKTDYIDIYWIHNPADVEKWTPKLIPLVKSGKIKKVGVSNHNLEQIKRAEEILSAEGIHVSAVQNHFSLLYRSSEKAGILDWCKERGVDFWAYMVLEQGALSGKYDTGHPMPADSMRGQTYNKLLPEIENLLDVMRRIGERHDISPAQVALSWAISKGTCPIIGVTEKAQVEDAVKAMDVVLTAEEIHALESVAAEAGVDTRGSWENPMV